MIVTGFSSAPKARSPPLFATSISRLFAPPPLLSSLGPSCLLGLIDSFSLSCASLYLASNLGYISPTPTTEMPSHQHQHPSRPRGFRMCDTCGAVEQPGRPRFRMCGGCMITQVRHCRSLIHGFNKLIIFLSRCSTAQPSAKKPTGPLTGLSASTPLLPSKLLKRNPHFPTRTSQGIYAGSVLLTQPYWDGRCSRLCNSGGCRSTSDNKLCLLNWLRENTMIQQEGEPFFM